MGLFSNNKLCPACGGATPRLLPTKIRGEALCKNCAECILADSELVKGWSLEDLETHLAYREKNQKQLEGFYETRVLELDNEILIDDNQGTFYVKKWTEDNPPVIRFDEVMGYELSTDYRTVEVWSRGMMRTPYNPPMAGTLGTLAALASIFDDDDDDKDESESQNFELELKLKHPYMKELEMLKVSAYGRNPARFQQELVAAMGQINAACNFIVSIAGTDGAVSGAEKETGAGASRAERAADDIRKYKELLDAGIITQEETPRKGSF